MNLSEPFIRKPIATTLIMVAVTWLGIICYFQLPVSNLPDVDYPTMSVTASFPGASPETMANTVAVPLEKEFLSIPGVELVISTNTLGNSTITLQFSVDRDIDFAAQDVETAINRAKKNLPPNLPSDPIYKKVNPAEQPILYLAISSSLMPLKDLYTLANTYLGQRISTVEGVSQVSVYGSPYAVRVQADPGKIASMGITLSEISNSIERGNPDFPTGVLDGRDIANVIITKGQLETAEKYQDLIISYKNGRPVRIRDIGKAVDSVQNDRSARIVANENGIDTAVVILAIQRQPGANTVKVVNSIKAFLPEMAGKLPGSVTFHLLFDRSLSIVRAVNEVQFTVLLAFALVVLVIFLFLGSLSDTIIPSLTLPVSIVGTFIVMYLLNYTLDTLSLLAIALSIGFIIDDAIVVLESIVRKIEEGLPPYEASLEGTKQIGFTIVSMSLSLVAVFIPMLFLGGIIGKIFHEFAIVLTTITLLSGVISLMLTPMVCSIFLRQDQGKKKSKFARFAARLNDSLLDIYRPSLAWALQHSLLLLFIGALCVIFSVVILVSLPTDFIPDEDIGLVIAYLKAEEGTSSEKMEEYTLRFIELARNNPNIETITANVASASYREAMLFLALKPKKSRAPAWQAIQSLYAQANEIPGIQVFFKNIPLIEMSIKSSVKGAYQYTLQSLTQEGLYKSALEMENKMRLATDYFAGVTSDLEIKTPQVHLEILRNQASTLGIDAADIEQELLLAFSANRVSRIQTPIEQYDVILELEKQYQRDPSSLSRLYIKNKNNGTLVPLGSLAKWSQKVGVNSINHTSQYPSVTITFNTPKGVPLSRALGKLEEFAGQSLTSDTIGILQGAAQVFQNAIKSAAYLLLYSFVAIYIILGILYEDFIHPLTILSTLPPAVFGGLLTLEVLGLPISLYAFLGIILLVGIVKKNGIMMVDYALQNVRHKGESPEKSILDACIVRFRPIMMTTAATIFASIPIAFTIGSSSETLRPLGLVIIGGMAVSQLVTLFLTPVIYLNLEKFRGMIFNRR